MSARTLLSTRVAHRANSYCHFAHAVRMGFTEAHRGKPLMAADARVILRTLARMAGIPRGDASTRYNAGGVAVSGEVYLSAPGLHAWIEDSCVSGPCLTFRTRAVRTLGGYATQVDGPNNTVPLRRFITDELAAAEVAQRMAAMRGRA